MPQKQLFMKYVYGRDISMDKSPISIILLVKIGVHCLEHRRYAIGAMGAKAPLTRKGTCLSGTKKY